MTAGSIEGWTVVYTDGCESLAVLGGNLVDLMRADATTTEFAERAGRWNGAVTGTHLELESKLRACLVAGTLFHPTWLDLGSSRWVSLFGVNHIGKGQAWWEAVLAILSPETAGG